MKALKYSLFALAAAATLWSCKKDDPQNTQPMDYVYVNEQINLTNMQYAPLRYDNGTVAIPGGIRGILIVRQSANQYYAFDRNCTFRPADSCAVVSLASSMLFLEDGCCGSNYNFDGTVRNGPATRALIRYNTSLSGNMLYITN